MSHTMVPRVCSTPLFKEHMLNDMCPLADGSHFSTYLDIGCKYLVNILIKENKISEHRVNPVQLDVLGV